MSSIARVSRYSPPRSANQLPSINSDRACAGVCAGGAARIAVVTVCALGLPIVAVVAAQANRSEVVVQPTHPDTATSPRTAGPLTGTSESPTTARPGVLPPHVVVPASSYRVVVPRVVGLSGDAAVGILQRIGFRVDIVQILSASTPAGTIVQQTPEAGAHVARVDDTVTISESVGDAPHVPTTTQSSTPWRPLDATTGGWPDAFALVRSTRYPAGVVDGLLRILRAHSDSPSEVISAQFVDEGGTDSLWVFERGIGDDSTTGVDIKLGIRTAPNSTVIANAEIRQRCARGVSNDRTACI